MIKFTGHGARLSKADITDAFKIILIHPSQWNSFGIKWESKLYFHRSQKQPLHLQFLLGSALLDPAEHRQNPLRPSPTGRLLPIDPPQDSSGTSLAKLKHCFRS
ncbi:hypothetical protein CesoFtcFv8_016416 [Champsocephalus esox]|uniref:Uncharacterized protein n=2 Tax=Champsocephalus TaxID=52236 RepID=A0AAN8HNB3_CHAGU|nr:hypothetical protein CesoFtcFv8_016416 [Champsocephalus esox]KAK5918309.1 hypothetical protein CgunFtcFv8_003083 [Champsocephalus gunnari]